MALPKHVDPLDRWLVNLVDALESEQPRKQLRQFVLNCESEAYNRALSDVATTLSSVPEAGPIISKVIAMRLGQLPKYSSMLRFPIDKNGDQKAG